MKKTEIFLLFFLPKEPNESSDSSNVNDFGLILINWFFDLQEVR